MSKNWFSLGYYGSSNSGLISEALKVIADNDQFEFRLERNHSDIQPFIERPFDLIFTDNAHVSELVEALKSQNIQRPVMHLYHGKFEQNYLTGTNLFVCAYNLDDFKPKNFLDRIESLIEQNQIKSQRNVDGLINSESLMQQSIDASSVEVFVTDKELRLIMFNNLWASEFKKYFGLEPFKGMSLVDPKNQPKVANDFWQELFSKALKGKSAIKETEIIGRNGLKKTSRIKVNPFKDENGKLAGVFCITENITEQVETRKMLKTKEEELELFIKTTGFPMVLSDIDGNVVIANENLVELLNLDLDKLIGANFKDLLPKEFAQMNLDRFKLRHESTHDLEFLDNLWGKWFKATYKKVEFQNQWLFQIVIVDLTNEIELESRLKRREKNLDLANNLAKVYPWELDVAENMIYLFGRFDEFLEEDTIYKAIQPEYLSKYIHPDDREWVLEELMQTAEQGVPLQQKHRFLINGKIKWARVKAEAIKNDNGLIEKVVGVMSDITESENYRLQLEEKEAIIEAGLETAQAYPWSYNIKDDHFRFHKNASSFFEEEFPENFEKEFLYEKFHEEDRAFVIKSYEDSLNKEGFELEHRYLINGKYKWVRVKAKTYYENDIPMRSIGIMQDITNEKEIQIELKTQRDLFETVINSVPHRIFWKDRESRYLGANIPFVKDAGLSKVDEIIGKTDYDLSWKEYADLYRTDDQKVMESNTPKLGFEEPYTNGDGDRLIVNTNKLPLKNETGEVIGVVSVLEDITKKKHDEEELLATKNRLDFALEGTGAAMWDIDFERNEVFVDNRWASMYGYKKNELEPINIETFNNVVFEEDRQLTIDNFKEFGKGGIEKYNVTFRGIHKNGSLFWIWSQAIAVKRDIDGKVLRIIGTIQNIDKLRRGEIALRKSEEQYRVISENLGQLIWQANANGQIIYVNKEGKKIFGSRYKDLMGDGWSSVLHPDDVENAIEVWLNALNTKSRYENDFRIIIDGQVKSVYVTASPILNKNNDVESWIGILLDRTDRVKAENELKESEQKFRSLVESSSDIFYIVDSNQKIKFISKQVNEILGYAPNEMIGKPFWRFIFSNDLEIAKNSLKAIESGQRAIVDSIRLVHKSGHLRWFKSESRSVLKTSDGVHEIHGVITCMDQIKENESLLKRSIERSKIELETTNALNKVVNESELFKRASEGLANLLAGQGIYTVNSFTANRSLKIQSLKGSATALEKALKIMNIDLEGYEIELTPKFYKLIKRGELIIHKGDDLGEMVEGRVSNLIYGLAKSIFKGYTLYTLPLLVDNKPKGTFAIFIQKSPDQLDLSQIKSFSNLVSNTWRRLLYYKKVEENTEQLEVAQDIAQIGSWRVDLPDKLEWSDNAYKIFEQDPSKGTSIELFDSLVHPADQQKMKQATEEALKTGSYNISYRIKVKSGIKWLQSKAVLTYSESGEPLSVIGAVQDITEFIRTENAIKEQNQFLEMAQEVGKSGGWKMNLKTEKVTWSKSTYEMFGIEYGVETTFNDFFKQIHPDDQDIFYDVWQKALKTKKFNHNYRVVVNGETKWMNDKASFEFADNVDEPYVIGTVQDITELVQRSNELHEKNQFLEMAQEVGITGSWKYNMESGELTWSDKTYDIMGLPVGKTVTFEKYVSLIHPDDAEYFKEAWRNANETFKYDIDLRVIIDGKIKWINARASFEDVKSGKGKEVIGTVQDITERRKLTEQIRNQNKKLQEIAWTQSHLVRAPLSNIMGLIGLFDMIKDDTETLTKVIKNIQVTAEEFDQVIKEITKKSEDLYVELKEHSADFDPTSKPSIIQE
jgi:PAS domain S-box-containing protein